MEKTTAVGWRTLLNEEEAAHLIIMQLRGGVLFQHFAGKQNSDAAQEGLCQFKLKLNCQLKAIESLRQ